MKRMFRKGAIALSLITALVFLGCPTDTDDSDDSTKSSAKVALVNTVWGGTTPQANNTGWVTVTFRADSKVVFAFSSDNTTNLWTIIDNTAAATKAEYPYILSESNASWMGPFKVDETAKTLVFNNWMGSSRTLNRLR